MIQDLATTCPTRTLTYALSTDYNTARADMFKDHVGSRQGSTCYDESRSKIAELSVSNTAHRPPCRTTSTHSIFDPSELRPGPTAAAVAMQRDWGPPPPLATVLATATGRPDPRRGDAHHPRPRPERDTAPQQHLVPQGHAARPLAPPQGRPRSHRRCAPMRCSCTFRAPIGILLDEQ